MAKRYSLKASLKMGDRTHNEIYVFDHASNASVPSSKIFFISTNTTQNGAFFQKHPITNLRCMIKSYAKTAEHRNFTAKLKVVDSGAMDNSKVWLTMKTVDNANTRTYVKIIPLTIKRPTIQKCDLEHQIRLNNENNRLPVRFNAAFVKGCNTDITDLTLEITFQDVLNIDEIQIHGVVPTSQHIGQNKIIVKYDRIYFAAVTLIKVYFILKKDISMYGSRSLTTMMEYRYKHYDFSNTLKHSYKQHIFQSFYTRPNTFKAFKLLDMETGYTLKRTSYNSLASDFNGEIFKDIPYNLKHQSGQCIGSGLSLVQCNATQRVQWRNGKLQFLGDKKYLSNKADGLHEQYQSTEKGSYFRKQYTNGYRLRSMQTPAGNKMTELLPKLSENVEEHNHITIIRSEHYLMSCMKRNHQSKKGSLPYCVSQNNIDNGYAAIKHMEELLGFDTLANMVYGYGNQGEIQVHRVTSLQSYKFVKLNLWKYISGKSTTILAEKVNDISNLTQVEEYKGEDKRQVKVSTFGIKDSKSSIIWPSGSNCHLTVSKHSYNAQMSCKDIKKYCPSVKSGVYQIKSKDGTVGGIYCDQENSDGGWMLVSRYTSFDNTFKNIETQLTDSIYDIVNSNYEKHIHSRTGLIKLNTDIGFNQIRFFCTVDNKTSVHIKTILTEYGIAVLHYIMENIDLQPSVCRSYEILPENTKSFVDCKAVSKWGNKSLKKDRLYKGILSQGEEAFRYGFNDTFNVCGSQKKYSSALWEVYLR